MTTSPFEAASWPQDPTLPTTAPTGYSTPQQPAISAVEPPRTSAEIQALRGQWFELIIRQIVQAFTGFFIPGNGGAIDQLANVAENIPFVGPFVRAGNELWNRLFDMLTGGAGSSDRTLNDVIFGGQRTLGAIVKPESADGAPGTLAGEIVTRLDALQPNTGAVQAQKIAGTVPLSAATATPGSAVGAAGGKAGNVLVNPSFASENALQAANGWSQQGGKGAHG